MYVCNKMETRLKEKLFLLDHDESQIIGAKLPSNGQVLRVLFYNLRKVKLNLRSSAHLVVKEVEVLWEKARIPTRKFQRSIEKLESLYQEWKTLQKTCKRRNQLQEKKEQDFINKMDDLFDIAHGDALEMINIEEDKMFLLNQRQKGRPGSMIGGDRALLQKEQRRALRREQEEIQRSKHQVQQAKLQEKLQLEFSSDDEPEEDETEDTQFETENVFESPSDEPGPSTQVTPKKRAKKEVVTAKLVATLDKCKVSDRDAVRIIIATAEALQQDLDNLIINRTSLRRCRKRIRAERAKKLRSDFNVSDFQAITIHWDGKILPALTGKEHMDRLPIIATCEGKEQLLGIPAITSSTGNDQASAVYQLLEEWELADKVQALCCDTTASNMGRLQGASVILEQKLGRDILYLPCRHHIYELVLRSVFEEKLNKSLGPNVQMFKKFQEAWVKINKSNFKPGVEDPFVKQALNDTTSTLQFALQSLQKDQQPREDYRELLELLVCFLGHIPPRGISFRVPGAFHHARWMAKGIYCLKMFLFREEFSLGNEETGIRDICIFLACLYVQAWTLAPKAVEAPCQDLKFIQNLHAYAKIDENTSRVALKKFCNHLWYLVPEIAAMSFFNTKISVDTKRRMLHALKQNETFEEPVKRYAMLPKDVGEYVNQGIENFISKGSLKLFDRFSLPSDFLETDPTMWKDDDSFKRGAEVLKSLKVVNDVAERGVKLMQDFNEILTKDEEEKQFILQIVTDYRRLFPDIKKSTLSKPL